MRDARPRFPNKLVVIGVFFVLVGGILLLWTAGYLDRFAALWPLLPVLAGLVLLYYRVFRSGPDNYLFLGTSLLLSGLLLQLTTSGLPVEMTVVWPLFLTIIGISLLLYGLRKEGAMRVNFVTPGIAMLVLSLVFLPFSLGLISADFASFVKIWWPVLLVLVGAALIVAHAGRGTDGEDAETDGPVEDDSSGDLP